MQCQKRVNEFLTTLSRNVRICASRARQAGSHDQLIPHGRTWNDKTPEQTIKYEATVGCLQSIVDSHIGWAFIFGGDFNVSKVSEYVCSKLVHNFTQSNSLCWRNPRYTGVIDYSYHNDLNGHFSLLDHFLVSTALVHNISDCVNILDDADNPSDHFAISCEFTASGLATDEHCMKSKQGKL